MSMKALLGTVTMATLLGLATQAAAIPQFKLRTVSGTSDTTTAGTVNPGGSSGTVSAPVSNIDGGGGNKFSSSDLDVQGSFKYFADGTLYVSLSVPDITHTTPSGAGNVAGSISFYLTLYDLTTPKGGPIGIKYDLSGFNAKTGSANNSVGNFFYSATNSSNSGAVPDPGLAIVTTPAISSTFVSTPECQLSGPGSQSYSCEYIDPVTLSSLYSLTQEITLNFAAGTKDKTARGQSSTFIKAPEPASLMLLSSGLLAAGFSFRRKAKKQAA